MMKLLLQEQITFFHFLIILNQSFSVRIKL